MDTVERQWYHKSASRLTTAAHLFGILGTILMLIWLLHYRGGLDPDSENPYVILNVYIFLMFFGFIFFAGQAMMIYKTVAADHGSQKFIHMAVHVMSNIQSIYISQNVWPS